MQIQSIRTRIFKEGEDLLRFVTEHIRALPDRSVLIVTSKVVALSEKRTQKIINEQTKIQIIKKESEWAVKTKYVWLTIKDNMFMASSGIDESNANGKLILLPKDSFRSAKVLRKQLMKYYKISHLGIIITDSRTIPLRAGVVGMATGYSGIRGIKDYRGKKDIFGRKLKVTRVNVADCLATAAVFTMGEGNEQKPLALIQYPGAVFSKTTRKTELIINLRDDIFRPLLVNIKKNK